MKLIFVVEADEKISDANYYRESFHTEFFSGIFDEIYMMGHFHGDNVIHTENIGGYKFGMEGRKILNKLKEKEDFIVYSTPIYWGPFMTHGLKIPNIVRYGLSIKYLLYCKKNGRCFHEHYLRYLGAKMLHPLFWKDKDIHFLALSSALEEELLNLGIERERISQIFPHINTGFFKSGGKIPKQHNIAFVSQNLDRQAKRPEMILDAARILKNTEPDIFETLSFVFTGWGKEFIQKQSYDLKDKILFPGSIASFKLRDMYRKSYLGVHPSYCEGGPPKVILEGMSCGVPFIGSDISGVNDILTGKLLFNTVDELAERISFFVKNPKVWGNYRKKSRKKILEMHNQTYKKYKRLFEDIIDKYKF